MLKPRPPAPPASPSDPPISIQQSLFCDHRPERLLEPMPLSIFGGISPWQKHAAHLSPLGLSRRARSD
jgi:hypothetical protein